MMKNKFLVCLLLMTLCLSAASCEVVDPALPVFAWERNGTEHWRQLPTGEKADAGAHVLEDMICTVCGSEVFAFEDGSADVSDYNDHEDLIRYTAFDSDGCITIELLYAYDYDDEGHLLASREFSGNVLTGEVTYTVDADGMRQPIEQVAYYEDDTWAINEYDAHGNLVRAATYDPNGDVEFESFSEYKLDENGCWYEASTTSMFSDGASFYSEYNAWGDETLTRNVDADGAVFANETYEYLYEDGVKRWKKHYSNGALIYETWYDETGLTTEETEYYDDGAKMVTLYNEYGDPVSVTSFGTQGQIETVMTYEYDYAEDLSWTASRAYVDGQLVISTEYTTVDGWTYPRKETVYDNDGSFFVCTFDENEELLSETWYDAAGNVIE